MTGFIWGVIVTAVFVACNNAAKKYMTKIHANDEKKISRMRIPGYAIYSYIMFLKDTRDEKKNSDDE